MKKVLFTTICLVLYCCLSTGCAPKQAYTTADALGQTSTIAGDAAISARKSASETGETRDRMVNDIKSIKETEKLFDEKSGIILSY